MREISQWQHDNIKLFNFFSFNSHREKLIDIRQLPSGHDYEVHTVCSRLHFNLIWNCLRELSYFNASMFVTLCLMMLDVTWQHRVEGFLGLIIKIPKENSSSDKYVLLLLLWVPSENLFIFSFTGDLGTDHDHFL